MLFLRNIIDFYINEGLEYHQIYWNMVVEAKGEITNQHILNKTYLTRNDCRRTWAASMMINYLYNYIRDNKRNLFIIDELAKDAFERYYNQWKEHHSYGAALSRYPLSYSQLLFLAYEYEDYFKDKLYPTLIGEKENT